MAASRHNVKRKTDVDPEAILRQKFRAKCRFRALVRLALANAYWLTEEAEQYEGIDNVKRRVAQAMRGKTAKKRLLSLTDKAILNKPAQDRTDHEKVYLYRIIGGFKCFKRYPNHVKKKLAASAYFLYYGPGRVVVREDQEAHSMFFIVGGDVAVTRLVYDELLNVSVPTDYGTMHTGDVFGDVSLLHNIPRTATCTTLNHCEFLILKKEDFKHVLQATIQASWDKILHAMSFFTYFDNLDEVARREGCIMAKMKTYNKNDIVLGVGVGVANYVYFLLSGTCQMIESLQISTTKVSGHTQYKLFDPHTEEEESVANNYEKYFSVKQPKSSMAGSKRSLTNAGTSKASTLKHLEDNTKKSLMFIQQNSDTEISDNTDRRPSTKLPKFVSEEVKVLGESKVFLKEIPEIEDGTEDSKAKELFRSIDHFRESVRFSTCKNGPGIMNLRTYFMQVCQFNPGSTFGFGENMRDRRIIALTPVYCMLLPKIWLLERNTANIWSRIQHYLEKKIPTKKDLFKMFVLERRWMEYREELVTDVVGRCNVVNWTSIHDIPYCIRLEEMTDL